MPPLTAASPNAVAAALQTANLAGLVSCASQLAAFLHALLEANVIHNLTRITTPADAISRHIVEPLAGWARIRSMLPAGPVLDVGSGGGSPGIPIAIADPARRVILLESRVSKAHFLARTVTALGLSNVVVHHTRAETEARTPARETAAAALARALAPPPQALELLLPLVRPGGVAALYLGPAARAQFEASTRAATILGGADTELQPLTWPQATRDLLLLTVRKHHPTPDRYPRTPQRMRRSPLGNDGA